MIYPAPKPKSKKRVRVSLKHGKPLARGKHIKAVNRKRGGSSFPKRRNYAFRKFVRENGHCILIGARRWCGFEPLDPRHVCNSPVRCCHIVNQARGGYDVGNIYGGCDRAHEAQHRAGSIAAFQKLWRVDCQSDADALAYAYVIEQGGAAVRTAGGTP